LGAASWPYIMHLPFAVMQGFSSTRRRENQIQSTDELLTTLDARDSSAFRATWSTLGDRTCGTSPPSSVSYFGLDYSRIWHRHSKFSPHVATRSSLNFGKKCGVNIASQTRPCFCPEVLEHLAIATATYARYQEVEYELPLRSFVIRSDSTNS
jgi:hypothetical protein